MQTIVSNTPVQPPTRKSLSCGVLYKRLWYWADTKSIKDQHHQYQYWYQYFLQFVKVIKNTQLLRLMFVFMNANKKLISHSENNHVLYFLTVYLNIERWYQLSYYSIKDRIFFRTAYPYWWIDYYGNIIFREISNILIISNVDLITQVLVNTEINTGINKLIF